MTGQQLKNSILQMAIQGKLVAQDPHDEPASVLLERIREEKKRLVKEGKIKKKELEYEKITEKEFPFKLPYGWTWVRLGELGDYRKGPFGSSLTKAMFIPKSSTSYKVYEQKNAIKKDALIGDYYISEDKFKEMQGFIVKPYDIIVSCAGTIGETYIIPQDAPIGIINQALMRVRLYNNEIAPYWMLNFECITSLTSKLKGSGSAIKNIPPFEILKNMVFPLPPLSEQRRIVEKLETLMPLIERYGKSQEELDRLNAALPDKLRQSILQEAIQGHLVPQDPNEEPVSVLLERIRAEKARLVKEGKLKKKDLEEKPIYPDEIPFDIPEGWVWCRINSILSLQAGKNVTAADISEEQNNVFQYPCYGGNGLRGFVKYFNTEGTYPLIGRQGALCGNVNMAESKFWATEHAVVVDGFNMTNVKWQYYALIALNLNRYATATAQPGLAVSRINDVLLPLPPLSEQRRIVTKLEELLQEIDKLKA